MSLPFTQDRQNKGFDQTHQKSPDFHFYIFNILFTLKLMMQLMMSSRNSFNFLLIISNKKQENQSKPLLTVKIKAPTG